MENDNKDIGLSLLNQNYQILRPKILVFGIGGAGTNAVNNMISDDFDGVDFIVANTDAQALCTSLAKNKIQLGPKTTKGLGAGMQPEIGREATEEVAEEIASYLDGANMIFITAGMGGGTGTGAAPVIAKMAKERDILTAAVVTKPFDHENNQRMLVAEKGIEELRRYVDTLIIVPNQNLYKIATETTTLKESFKMVDDVLKLGVKGITDLITQSGLVNLDFADIKTIMKKMGKSMMGMGEASGKDRAINAAQAAISNPLLDNSSIKGAKGIVVNITASPNFTLFEYEEATKKIKDEADPNAMIIIGNALNENMGDSVRISVFATGIEDDYDLGFEEQEEEESHDNFEDQFTSLEGEEDTESSVGSIWNFEEERITATNNTSQEENPLSYYLKEQQNKTSKKTGFFGRFSDIFPIKKTEVKKPQISIKNDSEDIDFEAYISPAYTRNQSSNKNNKF